jgi:hypothetical protein
MKKYTQAEVLDLVINTFNSNNRAVDISGVCRYLMTKDCEIRKCAVGILIPDELLTPEWGDIIGSVDMIFTKLPKEVQDLGSDFLAYIQSLHDSDSNWDEKGLSYTGKESVKIIRKKFNL